MGTRSATFDQRSSVFNLCEKFNAAWAETWAMAVATPNRLRHNDCAMICWICNVKANDEVSSDSLLSKLGLQAIDVVLRSSRMRWYGHAERSKGWIAQVCKLNIVAQRRSGKPRKSWDEVLLDDRKKLGMDTADPQNRSRVERSSKKETCQTSPTLSRGQWTIKRI